MKKIALATLLFLSLISLIINPNKIQASDDSHSQNDRKPSLHYLGETKVEKNQTFKVVNYTRIWGESHRATNRILFFDQNDHFLGYYQVPTDEQLPIGIKKNQLLFVNVGDPFCDENLVTRLDLSEKIPDQFLLKCQGERGDIVTFEKTKHD